ncbi:transcriptional regulator, XRE family, putative [Cyanobium sp. PCC 7001]|uniref:helix-turn-helix domain-containing protein n=1 Tax=Cyanobium sp. PCC 7001 TaxID=180281 RepID=UPI00018056C0|nr:helix-turn-helix domain-containing protein [Cyanobium sp. PCC 7001]EDY39091.1 transcriptional regulator, XRE family, putative [Cyanobium sp. PCC 7001]
MSADPNPDLQRLGACLHEARLREGISLEDLAQRLHMGREQLQSLEQADTDGLPEPVFVIAQARRVACALGVNIDTEIQALRQNRAAAVVKPVVKPLETGDTPAASSAPAPRRQPVLPHSSHARPGALAPGLKLVGVLALLGAGALAVWRVGPVAQQRLQQAVTTAASMAEPASDPAASGSPAPSSGSAPPPPATPSEPPQQAALVVKAGQPSWLEVRTSSGISLFRGTFVGERVFPYQGDLLVLAGRPDLVEVTAPGRSSRPLGDINDVEWQRFKAPAP